MLHRSALLFLLLFSFVSSVSPIEFTCGDFLLTFQELGRGAKNKKEFLKILWEDLKTAYEGKIFKVYQNSLNSVECRKAENLLLVDLLSELLGNMIYEQIFNPSFIEQGKNFLQGLSNSSAAKKTFESNERKAYEFLFSAPSFLEEKLLDDDAFEVNLGRYPIEAQDFFFRFFRAFSLLKMVTFPSVDNSRKFVLEALETLSVRVVLEAANGRHIKEIKDVLGEEYYQQNLTPIVKGAYDKLFHKDFEKYARIIVRIRNFLANPWNPEAAEEFKRQLAPDLSNSLVSIEQKNEKIDGEFIKIKGIVLWREAKDATRKKRGEQSCHNPDKEEDDGTVVRKPVVVSIGVNFSSILSVGRIAPQKEQVRRETSSSAAQLDLSQILYEQDEQFNYDTYVKKISSLIIQEGKKVNGILNLRNKANKLSKKRVIPGVYLQTADLLTLIYLLLECGERSIPELKDGIVRAYLDNTSLNRYSEKLVHEEYIGIFYLVQDIWDNIRQAEIYKNKKWNSETIDALIVDPYCRGITNDDEKAATTSESLENEPLEKIEKIENDYSEFVDKLLIRAKKKKRIKEEIVSVSEGVYVIQEIGKEEKRKIKKPSIRTNILFGINENMRRKIIYDGNSNTKDVGTTFNVRDDVSIYPSEDYYEVKKLTGNNIALPETINTGEMDWKKFVAWNTEQVEWNERHPPRLQVKQLNEGQENPSVRREPIEINYALVKECNDNINSITNIVKTERSEVESIKQKLNQRQSKKAKKSKLRINIGPLGRLFSWLFGSKK